MLRSAAEHGAAGAARLHAGTDAARGNWGLLLTIIILQGALPGRGSASIAGVRSMFTGKRSTTMPTKNFWGEGVNFA